MQSHCFHLSSGLIDMIGSNADAQRLNDELARLRAEVESLKDESARDYADMRRFQALYIEADHARLALRAEVETLKSEDARLRAENERLKGALQEIANTPTSPDNHDLVAVIMLAQYALRDDAPTAPPAR